MNWYYKAFAELSPHELYQILRVRSEVFVVEQNCVFLDMDNKDQQCLHFMGWNATGTLVAYTRIVPAGVTFVEASIGRVTTAPTARGGGLGRDLMQKSIEIIGTLYGQVPIRIGAQLYLKKFYESLGFITASEMYLEDDIEHIEMIRV